jgi:hypothetical protein
LLAFRIKTPPLDIFFFERKSEMKRCEAFAKFVKYVDRAIAPVPEHETECEARVRVLKDLLERCRLAETIGLRFKTANGWDDVWEIRQLTELRLAEAIRDLRFERGEY